LEREGPAAHLTIGPNFVKRGRRCALHFHIPKSKFCDNFADMNAIIRPVDITPEVVPMTVEALRLLDDQGFFANDNNRHELIDGVLVMVPPPGTGHQRSEGRANKALVKALLDAGLFDKMYVQTGGGIAIGDKTLLGPDLMVVREPNEPKEWTADDVIIMIEIAWSSIAYDLGDKAKRYAAAGIVEYWVLDVADKALIVHRDPSTTHYGSVATFRAPSKVKSLLEPSLEIAVADLF
jgi:Uma2 family endonuclease